jgi:hypothetical protein
MNFGELKSLTSFWLDDLNFGYFTETQVQTWLNNAQVEVQKMLIASSQSRYNLWVGTTLVIGQSDYVLPADFRKLQNLEIVLTGTPPNEAVTPIVPITTNQKYLIDMGRSTPAAYRFRKNRLVLQPAPDAALLMRMEYTYLVASMVNSTDTPDVPAEYHELIALLACADGFIKDGRQNPLLLTKIEAYKTDLQQDAQERSQDLTRSIVQTGDNTDAGMYF